MCRSSPFRFSRPGLLLLALLLPLAACAGTPAPQGDVPAPRIVGYDTVGKGESRPDAGKLDVLIFAFAHVRDGRVVLEGDAPARLRQLLALKTAHPELKVMVSVGGWGAGGFSEAATTAAGRKRFAESAVRLLATWHLDGLDVDWEYPGSALAGIKASAQDRDHFTALVRTLRATLDAAGKGHYLLTIASADGKYLDGIDLAAVAPYLDWFNVMTYDFNNSLTTLTGHHTGLRASAAAPESARTTSRAVRQYLAAGVPADKIVIGAAFYGLRFDDVKPVHDGLYQLYGHFGGALSWKKLKHDFIGRRGFVRHWDARARAPYLWNAATHSLITYDDPESLAAKAAWVKAHHLGGIMFWQAGQDDDNQLLDAIWNGLH